MKHPGRYLSALYLFVLFNVFGVISNASALTPSMLSPSPPSLPSIINITVDTEVSETNVINQGLNDFGMIQVDRNSPTYEKLKTHGEGFSSLVRIHVFLSDLCQKGEEFLLDEHKLAEVIQEIDNIQALGSEVLLMLEGSPKCVNRGVRYPILSTLFNWQDDYRPPRNALEYQHVLERIIRKFTVDRINDGDPNTRPIVHIEGWNEPDFLIVFFHGFIDEFIEKAFVPLGLAIQTIEQEIGIDITFYSPATSSGFAYYTQWRQGAIEYGWIEKMVRAAEINQFDLEGIAWHFYGAYPFIGLGEPEFDLGGIANMVAKALLQRVNPNASARDFYRQASRIKRTYPNKQAIITEWGIASGAADSRIHSVEGAAYTATSLSAMQAGGLDNAQAFTVTTNEHGWQHNLINEDGVPDQRWNALTFWSQLGVHSLPTHEGANPNGHDTWVTASRHENGDVSILIANYRGKPRFSDHQIALQLNGFVSTNSHVETYWLRPGAGDYDLPSLEMLELNQSLEELSVELAMPNQSVVILHFKQ